MMNEQNHENHDQPSQPSGQPREPINPRGTFPPPPPPPAAHYAYPPAPQPKRTSMIGSITKLGGLITLAFFLFIIGFYAALIIMNSGSGPVAATYSEGDQTRQIAIIPVQGMITQETADFVRRVVDKVIEDESIKAVVLRVDSPGGGVTPSDEIWHDLQRLRAERDLPIVASYGSYAASGGYYVSALADVIYAQPTTLTGSIGVIAQAFTFEELLQRKLGVTPEIIHSTAAVDKDTLSPFRNWTENDRTRLRAILDAAQEQFVKVVHEGRSEYLSREEVVQVATGRVLTADEALAVKLVDKIDYLDAALADAQERAGIDMEITPNVVTYRPQPSLGDILGAQGPKNPLGQGTLPMPDAQTAARWVTELGVPRMMYLAQ